MATEDSGDFVGIIIVLGIGIAVIYFLIQRAQSANQQTVISGPLNGSQVPKSTGENVETAIASSIPIVGPLTGPLVSYAETKPGASIVPQVTVGNIGTHTDTAGQQQPNQHTGFAYVGISKHPIYAVSGGAEATVLFTGGLSLLSSTNRNKVGSDFKKIGKALEFWDW